MIEYENLELEIGRANAILEDTITCLTPDSEVQALLESPGVSMAITKMAAVTTQGSLDFEALGTLAVNVFRLGAYLALKQKQVDRLLGSI